MSRKPQCVLVTPVLPRAHGIGLEQRAFQLLSDLAREYEVTLVATIPAASMPADDAPDLQPLLPLIEHFHALPVQTPRGWRQVLGLLLPPLMARRPAWAMDWPTIAAGTPLPPLPAHIDLLAVFRLRISGVADALLAGTRPRFRFLDLDDIESSTLASIGRRALRNGRVRLSLLTLGMSAQHWFQERGLPHSYDRIALANPDDCHRLRQRFSGAKMDCICRPNRVPLPGLPDTAKERSTGDIFTLAFLGTLNYFPNEDAAFWIARKLTPALRRTLPGGFRILIAGRGASDRLRAALERVPEVRFLGAIDALQPFYAQADAVLATVRCGGGTKIKLLEAVAHGCPVVTNPHTLRGTPFRAGEDLLCGASAEEIAACCAQVHAGRSAAEARARSAYAQLEALLTSPVSSFAGPASLPPSR